MHDSKFMVRNYRQYFVILSRKPRFPPKIRFAALYSAQRPDRLFRGLWYKTRHFGDEIKNVYFITEGYLFIFGTLFLFVEHFWKAISPNEGSENVTEEGEALSLSIVPEKACQSAVTPPISTIALAAVTTIPYDGLEA